MPRRDRIDTFFNMLLAPVGVSYSILMSIPNAMIIVDANLKIRFVNEKYLKLVNCKEEDLLGKSMQDMRPGTNLQQVIETGQTRTDLLSKTISNTFVDMSIPLVYKGQLVGGISFLKENERIFQLHKSLEEVLALNENLSMELTSFKNSIYNAKHSFSDLVGKSYKFLNAVKLAKKIALFDTDILIIGESGTGKELFSQAIHNESFRKDMPFIPVNCSTLTAPLIESELFGYEPNAFTGADKNGKIGLFMVADKGTIMLDEIGDLPFDMQAKLLRVLQERKVRKIGSAVETPVDVRIIAATNKDLAALVKEGLFRQDLYYRLSMFTLKLPSLCDRIEDIGILAEYLLKEWNVKYGRALSFCSKVYRNLAYHSWPGNIRELKNAVYFAAYTCEGDIINEIPIQASGPLADVPLTKIKSAQVDLQVMPELSLKEYVEEYEMKIITALIRKHGDSLDAKKRIASTLKISLPTLYNKLK